MKQELTLEQIFKNQERIAKEQEARVSKKTVAPVAAPKTSVTRAIAFDSFGKRITNMTNVEPVKTTMTKVQFDSQVGTSRTHIHNDSEFTI